MVLDIVASEKDETLLDMGLSDTLDFVPETNRQ